MAVDGAAYGVVVLAGGTSRRFGSDKLELLLDRTLAGLPPGGAVVCVGPARPTPARPDARWTREEPPGGGPLAGVAAGLEACSAPVVVVIGGDMPYVGRAVPALLATLAREPGRGAAVLVDGSGVAQPLASAWTRAGLAAALAGAGDPAGAPLRRLLDGIDPLRVPDAWSASLDVDTPADEPAG